MNELEILLAICLAIVACLALAMTITTVSVVVGMAARLVIKDAKEGTILQIETVTALAILIPLAVYMPAYAMATSIIFYGFYETDKRFKREIDGTNEIMIISKQND